MIRLNRREQTMIVGAGTILVLVLVYIVIVASFLDSKKELGEKLTQTSRLLQEYRTILADESTYREQLQARRGDMIAVNRLLLSGNTSSLAAADLSNKIRAFADESGVSITRETVQQPNEVDHHQQITIQLNMSCDVIGLRDILKRVERDANLLIIRNLEINAPASMRRAYRSGRFSRNTGSAAENLRITMTISGFIEGDEIPGGTKP
jgi:type II secretory pathway component PulM